MADIDAAFMKKIFHIAERKREANIQHDCQADDLSARFEIAKWVRFGHVRKYGTALPVSSWFALTMPGGGLIFLDSHHLNEVGSRLYGEAAASDIVKAPRERTRACRTPAEAI